MKTTLCWSCARAIGQCPWSGCDPETGELRYAPVPGWEAVKVQRDYGETYRVLTCPLYKPD